MTRKTVGMPMFTTIRAIMSPRRLRSSMNLVVIMRAGGDPRSPVVARRIDRRGRRAGVGPVAPTSGTVVTPRPPVDS